MAKQTEMRADELDSGQKRKILAQRNGFSEGFMGRQGIEFPEKPEARPVFYRFQRVFSAKMLI